MKRSGAWFALAFGVILIVSNILHLLNGGIVWRGVFIPSWTAWPELIIALLCIFFAIQGFRGTGTRQKQAEEAARAKAEMDRLYFQEHGHWPEEHRPPGEPPPGA